MCVWWGGYLFGGVREESKGEGGDVKGDEDLGGGVHKGGGV